MINKKERLKEKTRKHRGLTRRFANGVTNMFVSNLKIEAGLTTLAAAADKPDPFKFVITIKKIPNLSIKSISVHGSLADDSSFLDSTDDDIICKLDAFVGTLVFFLIIMATGNPDDKTTFTVTCDGTAVFTEAQEIVLNSNGQGGYSNLKAPLP